MLSNTPLRRLRLEIPCLFLLWGAPSLASHGFVVLGPEDPLPLGKFVFAVMHTRTFAMHFGYVDEVPTDPSRRVNTLLPGHTYLVAHAMGVSEEEFLEHHLPEVGQGKWVGGGFYSTGSELVFHRFYSLKAAGQLEESVRPGAVRTVNAVAEGVPAYHDSVFLAPGYWESFLRRIVCRFRMPLVLDQSSVFSSPYFSWNAAKHGRPEGVAALRYDLWVALSIGAFERQVIVAHTRAFGGVPRIVRGPCMEALQQEILRADENGGAP